MRGSDMLYQELPRIESTALDRLGRLLAPALAIAIALTIGIVLLLMGQHVLAAVAVVAGGAGAAIVARKPAGEAPPLQSLNSAPDYSLVGSSLGLIREPVTLTTSDGSMLVVNEAYRERFGSTSPLALAAADDAREGLKLAQTMALRDGAGCVAGVETINGNTPVE